MTTGGKIAVPCALTDRQIAIEACFGLGATWEVHGISLPPLAVGHLVLLDMLGSPFVGTETPITMDAVADAVCVQVYGPQCVQALFDLQHGYPARWNRLRRTVTGNHLTRFLPARWRRPAVTEDTWDSIALSFVVQMQYAFGGQEMICWKESAGNISRGLDMCWLAHQVHCIGSVVQSMTWREIVWEFPLAAASHLLASCARKDGATIRRPLDIEAAMSAMQMEAAS